MDKPHNSAAYAPLQEEEYTQQVRPYSTPVSGTDPNQAFAGYVPPQSQQYPAQPQPQQYPPQQYQPQPQQYPPQGYTPQPGYGSGPYQPPQPQGYAQPYPAQQPYGQQPVVMEMQSGYPPQPQVVYTIANDPYADATPFIPTSEPLSTQLAHVPKRMWAALSGPKMTTFNELKMHASWGVVCSLLALKVLILLVIQLAAAAIVVNQYREAGLTVPYYVTVEFAAWYTIISIPIGFFIISGFLTAFAQCIAGNRTELIGHPKFLQYCFCTLLISLPLEILVTFVGLIPYLGPILALAIYIYQLVLWINALKGIYHMSTGQAIGVIALFCACVFAFFLVLLLTVGFALVSVVAGAQ